MSAQAADTARDKMIYDIRLSAEDNRTGDNSGKSILVRGCDPVMAQKAGQMVKPKLGNPKFVVCTDDDDFLAKISSQKWDIVFFAPGACRESAAQKPIPGGRAATKGWGLEQYKQLVRDHQGDSVEIVETVLEREIIPLLQAALEK